MPWLDVEQNAEEWELLRVGRVGGSAVKHIMANYGKAFGEPAHKVALRVALEKLTGEPKGDEYTNEHMERGHEQEPIARKLYEDTYFCEVSNGGYYTIGEDIGVSPDGKVGRPGLIEIKSRIKDIHYANIKRGKYDPADKWQCCYNLKTAKAVDQAIEWIDYISFCPDFPEETRLFVDRIYITEIQEEFEMIDLRMAEFWALVREKMNTISSWTRRL